MSKVILLIFFLFINLIAYADDVGVLSTTQESVTQGDLVKLKVIDSRGLDYYSQYKNKRIGSLLYVIDVIEKDNDVYFDSIVSEMGPKEKLPKLGDNFILKGLNYYPSKRQQLMDFITLDIPIDIKKSLPLWIYFLFTLIVVVIGLWWYSNRDLRKKAKLQKQLKEKRIAKLQKIIQTAESEDDYANVYLLRDEITDYFELDLDDFKNLIDEINAIQYQPSWPKEEFSNIKKRFNKIKNDLKVKSGI